jgi:thioesterase domain-containing protein
LILERAHASNILPPDLDAAELQRLFRVFKLNVEAMLQYAPRAYDGRLTLFAAADNGASSDATSGWKQFAGGGLEVHSTPGTHYSFVRPPHVKTLAEQLRLALQNPVTQ